MRPILLYLSLNLLYITTFAQSTSKKTVMLADGSRSTYTVVDNSLNGPYLVKNLKDATITRGNYNNDQRVGNWYFLNADNSLFLRYNYDLKKVLSLDEKAIAFANIKIRTEDETESRQASVPLPLISIQQYVILLTEVVKEKIPSMLKAEGKPIKVDIVADIDESGKASYSFKYTIKEKQLSQRFDLVNQKFSIEWIPASLNNKKFNSQFSFNTEISFPKDNPSPLKRVYWN